MATADIGDRPPVDPFCSALGGGSTSPQNECRRCWRASNGLVKAPLLAEAQRWAHATSNWSQYERSS